MQSCTITSAAPVVVVEMVFLDKANADAVIATFDNQKVSAAIGNDRKPKLNCINRLMGVFYDSSSRKDHPILLHLLRLLHQLPNALI